MFFPIPDFKGFDFFPHNLRLPFMRYKGICFALSLIFMAAPVPAGCRKTARVKRDAPRNSTSRSSISSAAA